MFFSRKPNSFRGLGGFCWPIGVTAALLGRLLPLDGHKLVKKKRKFRPKSAPDRPLFDGTVFLNLYGEQWVLLKQTVITSVWWLQVLPSAQNSVITSRRTYSEHLAMNCAAPELQVVFWKPPIQKTESWYKFLDLKFRPKIRNLGPSGH
jgi:hypothetical protein